MKHMLHGPVDYHLQQTQFTDCRPVVQVSNSLFGVQSV